MDFFERQDKARKTTAWLVVIYSFFVVAIIVAIHAIVAVAAFMIKNGQRDSDSSTVAFEFWDVALDPTLLLASLGIVSGIILVGSLIKIAALSQGGSAVAESMGGRQIQPATRDSKERRLLNIVEEMALASGVQMPRVYVMDNELGINAFAAGFSTQDSAVAVTKGALELFNRDELQAVIGHEFSHILNGDMRLNIRMISVLSGILFIALMGSIILRIGSSVSRSQGRSSKKDNSAAMGLGLMAFGAAVWVIGSIGVLCARIMQAIIARQRETLADASSVQFTRNPSGMANALKIIGASANGGVLSNLHASEVSHMLFANGLKMNLFATHPRLEDRIRAIEPTFDGRFDDAVKTIQRRQAMHATAAEITEEDDLHESILAGAAILRAGARESWQGEDSATVSTQPTQEPEAARGRVPTPPPVPVAESGWMSETQREALRTTLGAQACLCAAVFSDDPAIRVRQIKMVTENAGSSFADRVDAWHGALGKLPMSTRRITCGMAVNTLRILPENELRKTLKVIDDLVSADGQIDAFEFALTCMFRSRLLPDVQNSRRTASAADALSKQAAYVLGVLANFGSADSATVAAAYNAGIEKLTSFGDLKSQGLPASTDLERFDAALGTLVRLPPVAKREFMEACEAVARYDGTLTDVEDNFLFAIADVIEATGWNAVAVPAN